MNVEIRSLTLPQSIAKIPNPLRLEMGNKETKVEKGKNIDIRPMALPSRSRPFLTLCDLNWRIRK